MSFHGTSTGDDGEGRATAASSKQYFCYQCDRTVTITPSPTSSELACPNCNGGFLEEYENPNPNPIHSLNPHPHTFFGFSSDNLSPFPSLGASRFVVSTSGGGGGGGSGADPTDLSVLFGGGGGGPNRLQSPDEFNPFMFLQNYLNTLRTGGANIQFVVENNNSIPTNLGDYFIGPGLEQLIQQLAENDPNRYGTPPAAKSAVEALPTIKITNEMLDCDSFQCAVCKDSFDLDDEVKQMPCKHIYHSDCIMPWLEMHNSCPVCRYELPTDDPDYENRTHERRGAPGPQSSGGGLAVAGVEGSQENPDTQRAIERRYRIQFPAIGGVGSQENPDTRRTMERRYRIQLPWLFRAAGEASNSRAGNGDTGNNNAGGSNSERQARGEDLD